MGLLQVPTLSQSIALIRARIQANNKNLNTLPGSVFSDVFVTPQAVSDTQQKALTYYNAVLNSLTNLLALENDANTLALIAAATNTSVASVITDISSQIDVYAGNLNNPAFLRKQPQKANVPVVYGRVDPPLQDLVVPIGAQVKGTNGQTYVTTGTVTMFAASASTYYDPNLLLFVISVPAQATVAGAAGNADAGTISSMITSVSGFTQVTNVENATGGQDLETDTDFVARLLTAYQALGATTQAGLEASVSANASVGSVYEAPPGDPFNLRGFGRTDMYIQDRIVSQFTETFSGFNHPTIPNALLPTKRPMLSLTSVSTGVAEAVLDATSALQGSVQSLDAIRFTTVLPVFPVTVSYTYNSLVAVAQNVFNSPQLAPATQQNPVNALTATETAILLRQAPQLLVDYTVTITVTPNSVKSQVIIAVVANILAAAAAYVLGQTVFVDDVNKIIENTAGVLRLSGDPTKFSPSNQAGVLSSIVPNANQVIVFNNLNIF